MTPPTVGVVVLAYGDEPYLAECVAAVLRLRGRRRAAGRSSTTRAPSRPAAAVDAATTRACGAAARSQHRLRRRLQPRRRRARHRFVALVNSDCVIAPDTLALLAAEAARPGVGPVMASIRLADQPALLNSAGNPVHLIGLSWAGGDRHQRETRTEPFDVTGASGACLLLATIGLEGARRVRRGVLRLPRGHRAEPALLAAGLAARCVPTAVARHHYEFSRNAHKMYLLERNRLMLLATVWPRRALSLLAPAAGSPRGTADRWRGGIGLGRRQGRGLDAGCGATAHTSRARVGCCRASSRCRTGTWMARLTPDPRPHAIGPAPLTQVANVGSGPTGRSPGACSDYSPGTVSPVPPARSVFLALLQLVEAQVQGADLLGEAARLLLQQPDLARQLQRHREQRPATSRRTAGWTASGCRRGRRCRAAASGTPPDQRAERR